MAFDKIVDSAALDAAMTYTANRIRNKTGDTNQITWDSAKGFGDAVDAITSGGADHSVEDAIITRSISGDYENDRITTVGNYAFGNCSNLTSVILPNCSSLSDSAFAVCRRLLSASLPKCESIGGGAFITCQSLNNIDAPILTTLGNNAFYNSGLLTFNGPLVTSVGDACFQSASRLTSVALPLVTTVPTGCLRKCTKLERVDLGAATSIARTAFTDSAALETLIIRTETLCTIADASVTLRGSKIAAGTGYIYVPDELVDAYKEETNWVVFANQIRGLSELEAST